MRKTALFAAMFALLPAREAFAGPTFEECVKIAPKSCALTDASPAADVRKCFEGAKLDRVKGLAPACAEELAHAKVHDACGKTDIPGLCGKVRKGGNRTMTCLYENHDKLTKPCAEALDGWQKLSGGKKKMRSGSGVAAVRC